MHITYGTNINKTKHNWIKIYVLKYRIYIYKHIHKSIQFQIQMERTEMENGEWKY